MKYGIALSLIVACLFAGLVVARAQTDSDPYANLPQSQSLQGFPTLGYPSALINLIIYAAFDDPASAQFWQDSYKGLLPRVQTGEIRLVFVPLSGRGDIPGGLGAARAAICAGDQGKFWQYQDQLFAAVLAQGSDAYTGDKFLQTAQGLNLDMGQWTSCITGDGPDAILDDGARSVANEPLFTNLPFIKVGDSPSLTDLDSLNFTIDRALQQANAELTAQEQQPTLAPDATEEPTPVQLGAVTGQNVPPPLTMNLPAGWESGTNVIVLQDIDAIRNIPFAVYTGPVTGGTGTIVLLWGFPNLVNVSAATQGTFDPSMIDLYTDGTRLLRLAVVEEGCNVGTDIRRTYSIGGLQAVGTQFAAVDCPELADTRGWFAGLQQYNLNFVFYAYAEPISVADAAEPELQAILDSVQFVLPPASTPSP